MLAVTAPRHGCARAVLARALSLSALAASSCAPSSAPVQTRVATVIQARSSEGREVAGARLWADGRELGTTDSKGHLDAVLAGREGARIVITAACPSAYRTLDERREVVLHRLGGSGGRGGAQSLQLSVTCEPLELVVALVARVRGAGAHGLPLRVQQRVVGQTDSNGIAHVALRARPDASVTVELDTSAVPELAPANPVQTFQLGKQPSVLLFEQTLTRARPAGRAHTARPPPRRLPYRID